MAVAASSPNLMVNLIRTVHFYSESSCAAIVRLPTHGHEWIAWALDAGAAGIILPHVSLP
jgi:4-hydroxy-2-oxoheptanedioate aldolase